MPGLDRGLTGLLSWPCREGLPEWFRLGFGCGLPGDLFVDTDRFRILSEACILDGCTCFDHFAITIEFGIEAGPLLERSYTVPEEL